MATPPELQRAETDDGVGLAWRAASPPSGATPVVAPAMSWLADDLRPLTEHLPLVFYDTRGQGSSDRVRDDQLGLERDVADVECVRRALGAERIHLLGWSYHGAVTAHYARAHPERVERLVLVAPLSPRATPYWRQYLDSFGKRLDFQALGALEKERRAGLPTRDPEAWCRAHTDLILRVYVEDPACLAAMRSSPCVGPNLDPERVNQQTLRVIEALGNYDWREELRTLRTPTLILHGDRDLVPPAGSREWHEALPHSTLVDVPGSGHLPWLEHGDAFFPPVLNFLSPENA
jgi:proline iminopeptidase